MTNNINSEKYLEKILDSKEFSNSSIYINYLTYLVKATKNDNSPKETTIAMEVFGKDADFNPAEDTIVRSHTYTLRKKLERYYFTEGKDDKFRLKIPKGHYEVTITKVNETRFTPSSIILLLKKRYKIILIILLVLSLFYFWFDNLGLREQLKSYQVVNPSSFIWKEIIHSDLPILVVPGDHFLYNFYSREFQRDLGVRDMMINSQDELDSLQLSFPQKNLSQSPEPYFPYHSIWSLPPVLSVLYSNGKKAIMRKASTISPQMLDEYNVVYLGSIKSLYAFKHLLSRTNFAYNISPHKIVFNGQDSTQVFKTNLHSSGPNEDLVLALKIRGPVNNAIYIIASYHSLGAPEVANYLISAEGEAELKNLFEQKYSEVPEYFGILFRVTGIDKTAYKTEVLAYEMYANQ